jgi:fatty-acyl-CoA synthase
MPGPDLSPAGLAALIESERVTLAAGVPTIWMGVLPELEGRDTASLRAIPCGGSAVPRALSEAYREKVGLPITQAWGMTETSPVASSGGIKSTLAAVLDDDGLADLRTTVGQPLFGVEARIVQPGSDDEQPWDGESSGELQVRGPWVASSYYDDERSPESFTDDGWLKTGDVATIDAHGYIRLVDRTKDVIKSGGEWISSVDLENEIMAHPAVAEAAVIGVDHPKWGERPLACVVVKPGESVTREDVLAFLTDRVAKWWLPDDVVFIDEVPKTSVGKFSKKDLRARFADYALPGLE